MWKRFGVLFFALNALPAFAVDETQKLLEAIPVKGVIQLEITTDKKDIAYKVDDVSPGTLTDGDNFAAPHGIELTYKDFNPFKVTVTSTETAAADPVAKAIGEFLDALSEFAKTVISVSTPANRAMIAKVGSLDCDEVRTAVNRDAEKPLVDQSDLSNWINQATGKQGIIQVRKDVQAKVDQLKTSLTNISKILPPAACPGLDQAATADVTRLEASEKRLKESLEALVKMLDDYIGRPWRNGDMDLLIRTVNSDPAQQKTIAVTVTTQKADLDKFTVTNDAKVDRTLVVRRYRKYVPEVGLAAVYNDLKYPKYSIEGGKVVKKDDSSNVDAAMTMNLLCNCVGGGFLYPGAQLGVSKAKDYPGLLAGIVLRFAQPKQFSIAVGRMVTWYKDVQTLKVGDETTEEKLKADLKRRRSPTAWYLAAQFTF